MMAARRSAQIKSPRALSPISKCHTKLLETTVTRTKQTKAIVSTSHKIAVRARHSRTINRRPRLSNLPVRALCVRRGGLIGTPKRLEIAVTPRKHSSPPSSNRDKIDPLNLPQETARYAVAEDPWEPAGIIETTSSGYATMQN